MGHATDSETGISIKTDQSTVHAKGLDLTSHRNRNILHNSLGTLGGTSRRNDNLAGHQRGSGESTRETPLPTYQRAEPHTEPYCILRWIHAIGGSGGWNSHRRRGIPTNRTYDPPGVPDRSLRRRVYRYHEDAEACLKIVTQQQREGITVWIFTDNQAAIHRVSSLQPGPRQDIAMALASSSSNRQQHRQNCFSKISPQPHHKIEIGDDQTIPCPHLPPLRTS
jgi:hypothetical protein